MFVGRRGCLIARLGRGNGGFDEDWFPIEIPGGSSSFEIDI